MNEQALVIKEGDLKGPRIYSYLPTIEDLQNIFSLLPPADKVKAEQINVPVEMIIRRSPVGNEYAQVILPDKKEVVGHILFKKFISNGKPEWIYDGIVKYKN